MTLISEEDFLTAISAAWRDAQSAQGHPHIKWAEIAAAAVTATIQNREDQRRQADELRRETHQQWRRQKLSSAFYQLLPLDRIRVMDFLNTHVQDASVDTDRIERFVETIKNLPPEHKFTLLSEACRLNYKIVTTAPMQRAAREIAPWCKDNIT